MEEQWYHVGLSAIKFSGYEYRHEVTSEVVSACSDYEAIGKAIELCETRWPKNDGWQHAYSANAVPDVQISRRGATLVATKISV